MLNQQYRSLNVCYMVCYAYIQALVIVDLLTLRLNKVYNDPKKNLLLNVFHIYSNCKFKWKDRDTYHEKECMEW